MKALLLLLILPSLALARSDDGWDTGNAGDTYTAEFILTARDLVQRLKLLPSSERQELDLNQLSGAVLNAQVHSEEQVFLNGFEVDAVNYPARQEIVISRSRWRALRMASETNQRLLLVLHEYLFLIGIDDTQFRLSGRLVPQMGVKDFNPNRWWNPLNPVNRVTLGLVFTQKDCALGALDFDLLQSEENISVSSTGDCGEAFRKVTVLKSAFTAPPSSGAHGTFHRFDIHVQNRAGEEIGTFTYEPEWGQCLLPQEGACRLSGKIFVGGVEILFWMLR